MEEGKYMYQKEGTSIVHCPFCRGVILKCQGEHQHLLQKDATLTLRCPHCGRNIAIHSANGDLTVKASEESPASDGGR